MPNPYDALQFSNPGNALMQAYDQGAARRDKADLQTALEAYSTNPQDSRALAKIMAMNPALGATLQDRSREASARDAFANLATGPMASPGIGDGMQGNAPAA